MQGPGLDELAFCVRKDQYKREVLQAVAININFDI